MHRPLSRINHHCIQPPSSQSFYFWFTTGHLFLSIHQSHRPSLPHSFIHSWPKPTCFTNILTSVSLLPLFTDYDSDMICAKRFLFLVVFASPPPGEGAKYCDQHVCVWVCSLAYFKRHTSDLYKIVSTSYLWPSLGSFLTTVRYVMNFRFCGWRHVFK